MNTTTKTLFGGALLTAGMSMANAQSFSPQPNPGYASTAVGGYVYDFYAIGYLPVGGVSVDGGLGDSYSYANAYGSASASISANALEASSDGFGNTDFLGGAFAYAYGYLQVTSSAALNLNWDFTGEGSFGPLGVISVVDFTNGGVSIFETDAFTAGSDSVNLSAGVNYGILVVATSAQGTSAFASAVLVPAPGAMGLLGAAGLVAARRRR